MSADALGPVPTPAPAALSRARARVAAAVRELGPGAPLAAIAERLGGHPNATRQHLDALVRDGHATAARLPHAGRGRPARGFTLTAAGVRALAASGLPLGPGAGVRAPAGARAYAEVVDAVAAHLVAGGHASAEARAIGRTWGGARASADVEHLLAELGFDPHPADEATLHLRACPILSSAQAHPEVICSIHQGLVEGVLGVDDGVLLVPFARPGACVLRLPLSVRPGVRDGNATRDQTATGALPRAIPTLT